MQETRRSFLHVTEISAALQIRESDYKFTGTWLGAIGGTSLSPVFRIGLKS